MNRRWVSALIAVPTAVVLAITAGTWVYINFVHGDAPPKLTLGSTTTTTAGPAAGVTTTASGQASATDATGVSGTWKVTAGSVVGYRVTEVLFGQRADAVGRTSGVTGEVRIDGTAVTAATFTADMTSVASNEGRRDGQFRGRIMEVARFPTATFQLTKPIDFGSVPADGSASALKGTGTFTIHGVTKPVTIDMSAQRSGSTIKVAGSIPVVFATYNISNPSGGPAQTEDHGIIEVLLVLAR